MPNVTKYSIPQLPTIVHRQRLVKQLDAHKSKPLVVVLGQAAQGKTTLVADYLNGQPVPAVWLKLGTDDHTAAGFFHNLSDALFHGAVGKHWSPPTKRGKRPESSSNRVNHWQEQLQSLWRNLSTPLNIVLDGLDRLGQGAAAWPLIHWMCSSAKHIRIFLISRDRLPFKLQQWAVQQRLWIVGNDELAFTVDEIAALFSVRYGMALSEARCDHIQQITDGWPGGLIFLLQALSRIPQNRWDAFLGQELAAFLADETRPYFSEEVIGPLSSEIQSGLVRSAIFETIDPEFLAELADKALNPALLDTLLAGHLFIKNVSSDRQRPCYRFNPLFRSCLLSLLQTAGSASELRALYRKAAQLFRKKEQWRKAVRFQIRAQDFPDAAQALKKIGMDYIIQGQFEDLHALLQAIPDPLGKKDPWLFFLLTLTRRLQGGARTIADLETILDAFAAGGDERGEMLALAYLIEAHTFGAQDPAACRRLILRGEAWLERQSQVPYYTYVKTLLWLQIGFGYIAAGLNVAKGVSACQNAYLMARKMNAPTLMAHSAIVSVLGLASAGDFPSADTTLEKIQQQAASGALPEYNALEAIARIELALRRGNLDEVQRLLARSTSEIETFGLLFLYPAYVDAGGFLQIYQGRWDAAHHAARHLFDVATLTGNAFYKGLAHRLTALIHYWQGHWPEAADAGQSALALLSSGGTATLNSMRTNLLLGLVRIHRQHYDAAEGLLLPALAYFQKSANILSQCETNLALAMLRHARRETKQAAEYLEAGFRLAAQCRLSQLVMLSPGDLSHLCRLAAAGEGDSAMWARHLLQSRFAEAGPHEIAASRETTERGGPAAATQQVRQGYLDIRTFGGFQVLRDGRTPITGKHWGGRRPKLLLQAIVVHGLREIPKDILIDDLWPESTPQAALQNFKVTMHRLRRILEPESHNFRGSAYIHLKDNLVSLDKEKCHVDVEQFLQRCKDIKRMRLSGEAEAILSLGRQVMELYKDDFMPEEPYAPWAEMKRWALKDEYIAVLMQMTDIYQQMKRLEDAVECYRAILNADPCREQASRRLMSLYADLGRRHDASKVYEHLCAHLKNDLDMPPDPATTTLYQQIRSSGRLK